ncbi:uncharacterized protein STEHIDRAFT_153568 [Stereum hirsutum FP-91666 SS1]|uniref:uncharacterized protein n=1 Tax=Stereum hirsutum (strain FP-91666) TaxID=721885 RepID=UPI000440F366|nr:uncharacterized protein STEHIDRAFT_153568 [Stereum hirsutum FP-91666 SS1]EIM89728.1 hypothetical protein STEHIDRAFT_153568 [Stereum hirsutum FP-91666 SS1]
MAHWQDLTAHAQPTPEFGNYARMALLETGNDTLTPAEVQQLRALVASDETELAHIHRAMLQLTAREEVVRAGMKKKLSILCFIRRLPPEIIAEIFTVWRESGGRFGSRTNTTLWPTSHLTGARSLSTLPASFLLRSGPHPIDLEPTVGDTVLRSKSFEGAEHFLKALIPSMSRLQKLSLRGLPGIAWEALDSGTPQASYSMPILEELYVRGDIPPPQGSATGISVFLDAPRLRCVSLSTVGDEGADRLLMPWSRLETLDISWSTAADVRPVLLQSLSLERCHLSSVDTWDEDEHVPAIPLHTFPYLHEFDICFEYDAGDDATGGGMQFFQPLSMPALAHLRLGAIAAHSARKVPLLVLYVFTRSKILTSLSIYGIVFDVGEMLQVLRLLPILEELRCERGYIANDELFEALQYSGPPNAGTTLVPRLQDLFIFEDNQELGNTTTQIIEDMVLSRWWSDAHAETAQQYVARWRSIHLCWEGLGEWKFHEDEAFRETLQQCRQEGLQIKVYSGEFAF